MHGMQQTTPLASYDSRVLRPIAQVLYLCRGARFEISYAGQRHNLVWHGISVHIQLIITANSKMGRGSRRKRRAPAAADLDRRMTFHDEIEIKMVEGEGRRAAMLRAAAKRAGVFQAADGVYRMPFAARLAAAARPAQPNLRRRARTAHDFTVEWRAPDAAERASRTLADGSAAAITHYAIEIASPTPNGTLALSHLATPPCITRA